MIALITPTGARAKQIRLCAEYMKKQNYEGGVFWLVVDDAQPRTSYIINADKEFLWGANGFIEITTLENKGDFRKNWEVVKIYPQPAWQPGQNTQARNLKAGIQFIKDFKVPVDSIFIIEDDDWYSEKYLSEMVKRLKGFQVVGETNTIYYNIKDHTLRPNRNTRHASLFQTGFTLDVLPLFERVLEKQSRFIDLDFFKLLWGNKVNLLSNVRFSVGMKGLSGRPGIGVGHTIKVGNKPLKMSFAKCMELKELIGMDYLNYL